MAELQASADAEYSKTEVILTDFSCNPSCDHGPAVLFSRGGQKYYACSAYRSRKLCSFYMEEAKWVKKGQNRINLSEDQKRDKAKPVSFDSTNEVLSRAKRRKLKQKGNNTDQMVDSADNIRPAAKNSNKIISTKAELAIPSRTDNKGQAQYLFSSKTLTFITKLFESLEIKNVICVGVPKLHSMIIKKEPCNSLHLLGMKSYLLDIDTQFKNLENFSHYNMCNHHFFNDRDKKRYFKFLQKCNNYNGQIGIICDPAFGAKIELILNGIHCIQKDLENVLQQVKLTSQVFLVHPYFSEGKILKIDSSLKMCDFKIEYETHKKFKNGKNSPVRLFTNVPLDQINFSALMSEETDSAADNDEYKYCSLCDKHVFKISQHCRICHCCSSKDGKPTKHCYSCNSCVKQTWEHCPNCNSCHFPGNSCKLKLKPSSTNNTECTTRANTNGNSRTKKRSRNGRTNGDTGSIRSLKKLKMIESKKMKRRSKIKKLK